MAKPSCTQHSTAQMAVHSSLEANRQQLEHDQRLSSAGSVLLSELTQVQAAVQLFKCADIAYRLSRSVGVRVLCL